MASAVEEEPYDEVRIIVEGRTIACEKRTLMEKSDYFQAMFESNMVECQTGKVTLQDQSYEIVNQLVSFIQTGVIHLEPSTVVEVAEAAVMLQIPTAINKCERCMIDGLDQKCCVRFMHFAKALNLKRVYKRARRLSLQYFHEVVQDVDFFLQDLSQILNYLSDKHLNCQSELEVLDACTKWVRQDEATRRDALKRILSCVHPEEFTDQEWDIVRVHPLLQDGAGHNVLETWLQNRQSYNRKFREVPVVFMTFGGVIRGDDDSDRPCSDICEYDEETEEFTPTMSLRNLYPEVGLKMGNRVTVVGTNLYLTGGQACLTRSRFEGLWVYNGISKTWSQLDSPTVSRRHHGACASDTCLYVLGGFGQYRQILNSVEKYDTISGKWSSLPKIPIHCFSPEVVYLNNRIYMYKSTLSYLDLKALTWTTVTTFNNHYLASVQLIVVNQYIYEFPYVDNKLTWLCDCDKVPFARYNTETETYENLSSDGVADRQFGNKVVVHNNTVYMINLAKEFVCCDLYNMKKIKRLGSAAQTGTGADLVALPCYTKCNTQHS